MRNSILFIVLALICSMNMTGCSLFSSSEEDQETATVSEDGEFTESADSGDEFGSDDFESDGDEDLDFDAESMAKEEGEEEQVEELAGQDVEAEDNFGEDDYPDDDYGNELTAMASNDVMDESDGDDYIDDNSFASESSETVNDSLFVDEGGGGLPTDTMASNQDNDLFVADSMEPVIDEPSYGESMFDGGDFGRPKFIPVKKMKPAAYKRAGANVNRLYVVRPGDNMDSIATKVYGNPSRAEDLYSYNSHFRGKTLNVGDKVYYESPNNPQDASMMTYYEDNNMAPQYYTSQEGDNIRKVSKKLLGHDRSWMEVYATNANVDSKSAIPGGLQIRYWPDGVAPAPTMAMNEPEPPTPPPAMEEPEMVEPPAPEADMAMNEPEMEDMDDPAELEEPQEVAQVEDPEMDMGDEDFNPPPAAGQVNNNPPPPPKPVAAVAPPPPPPAPKANFNKPKPPKFNGPKASSDGLAAMGDDSMIMGTIGVLLVLAAVIMLIFIRRSRAKRVNFSQTQV